MIDFRYHLVSLVSVFLALAVGIVLGAGPLKGQIGDTLTAQVDGLRQDRDSLKAQLQTAQQATDHRDAFLRAVSPTLVGDQLVGRSIVLVRLPGVSDASAANATQSLERSGAVVTGEVDLTSDWTDPASAAARQRALARLVGSSSAAGSLSSAPTDTATPDTATPDTATPDTATPDTATPGTAAGATDGSGNGSGSSSSSSTTSSTTGTADATVARLAGRLSSALLTDASGLGEAGGAGTITVLQDEGLLDLKKNLSGRAVGALVLVPPVASAVQGASPSPTSPSAGAELQGWLQTIAALSARGSGAVVLGPASSAAAGGLIGALRADAALSDTVSTVDTGDTPMGPITSVLALSAQAGGTAGAYGFESGAQEVLPTSAAGVAP